VRLPKFEDVLASVVDRSRREMIARLSEAAQHAENVAKAGQRSRANSPQRDQSEEARGQVERYGRILYFLQHADGELGAGATTDDVNTCIELAKQLKVRGEWPGAVPEPIVPP
jgi:hypothetical protein